MLTHGSPQASPRVRTFPWSSPTSSQDGKMRESPTTSGRCFVCSLAKDSALDRFICCSACLKYYHRSCHNPPITRSILRVQGANWTCARCLKKTSSPRPYSLNSNQASPVIHNVEPTVEKTHSPDKFSPKGLMADREPFPFNYSQSLATNDHESALADLRAHQEDLQTAQSPEIGEIHSSTKRQLDFKKPRREESSFQDDLIAQTTGGVPITPIARGIPWQKAGGKAGNAILPRENKKGLLTLVARQAEEQSLEDTKDRLEANDGNLAKEYFNDCQAKQNNQNNNQCSTPSVWNPITSEHVDSGQELHSDSPLQGVPQPSNSSSRRGIPFTGEIEINPTPKFASTEIESSMRLDLGSSSSFSDIFYGFVATGDTVTTKATVDTIAEEFDSALKASEGREKRSDVEVVSEKMNCGEHAEPCWSDVDKDTVTTSIYAVLNEEAGGGATPTELMASERKSPETIKKRQTEDSPLFCESSTDEDERWTLKIPSVPKKEKPAEMLKIQVPLESRFPSKVVTPANSGVGRDWLASLTQPFGVELDDQVTSSERANEYWSLSSDNKTTTAAPGNAGGKPAPQRMPQRKRQRLELHNVPNVKITHENLKTPGPTNADQSPAEAASAQSGRSPLSSLGKVGTVSPVRPPSPSTTPKLSPPISRKFSNTSLKSLGPKVSKDSDHLPSPLPTKTAQASSKVIAEHKISSLKQPESTFSTPKETVPIRPQITSQSASSTPKKTSASRPMLASQSAFSSQNSLPRGLVPAMHSASSTLTDPAPRRPPPATPTRQKPYPQATDHLKNPTPVNIATESFVIDKDTSTEERILLLLSNVLKALQNPFQPQIEGAEREQIEGARQYSADVAIVLQYFMPLFLVSGDFKIAFGQLCEKFSRSLDQKQNAKFSHFVKVITKAATSGTDGSQLAKDGSKQPDVTKQKAPSIDIRQHERQVESVSSFNYRVLQWDERRKRLEDDFVSRCLQLDLWELQLGELHDQLRLRQQEAK